MSYNHFSDNDNLNYYSSRGTFGESVSRELLHLKLLLKKNFIVASRSLISTVIELLSPIVFILILLGISKINNNQNPDILYNQQLPVCQSYGEDRCFNLMFSPMDSPAAIEIIKIIAENNQPQLPIYYYSSNATGLLPDLNNTMGFTSGIIGMNSVDDIYNFTLTHPNVTIGGVQFLSFPSNFSINGVVPTDDPLINPGQNEIQLGFNVLVNTSCPLFLAKCPDYTLTINSAVQRAITIYYSQQQNQNQLKDNSSNNTLFEYISNSYPKYPIPETLAQAFGGLFYYCGAMITFIFLLYKISFEKEHKLKQGMIMMGLSGPMYWVSWFINCFIIDLLITLITIAVGSICQLNFFLGTNFFVLFFTFLLFTVSMSAVAFFLLTFIQSTKVAIGIGMGIFIFGSVFQIIFNSMGNIIFQLIYEADNTSAQVARVFLFILPMFHFSKVLTDISAIISNYPTQHYRWSQLTVNLNSSSFQKTLIPTTAQSLGYLVILCIAYIILAWYFEHVIPGNDGTSNPPYFFLLPSYWGLTLKKVKHIPIPTFEDEDVRKATERAHDPSNTAPVIIRGLSKTYTKLFNPKKNVHAVKFLSLSIEQGTVLCFLGSNGAGKTTTISMLTGLISPSSGDASIFGHSIVSDIAGVRKITSVVPQHDILWNELTAREHLQLFAELKSIPKNHREAAIRKVLDQVRLTKVSNNQISTYSGGMKRRLSVAIACIGDPKLVILDEPTCGTDPASRRKIWELLKEIKKDKVLILTSHLMDECEILGDRIVIMSNGVMACNGNLLQLKNKFGEGYSVNLVAKNQEAIPFLVDFVLKSIPNSKFLRQSALLLNFGFPVDTDSNIVYNFFGHLESMVKDPNNNALRDWEIGHSNLNDVFLKVVHLSKLKSQ